MDDHCTLRTVAEREFQASQVSKMTSQQTAEMTEISSFTISSVQDASTLTHKMVTEI